MTQFYRRDNTRKNDRKLSQSQAKETATKLPESLKATRILFLREGTKNKYIYSNYKVFSILLKNILFHHLGFTVIRKVESITLHLKKERITIYNLNIVYFKYIKTFSLALVEPFCLPTSESNI